MEEPTQKHCDLCDALPYSVHYLKDLVMPCKCGNILKVKMIPAIYIGIFKGQHICHVPFPGCTVCGLPMNMPWSVGLNCMEEGERAKQFMEVYHNYGSRN